MQKDGADVSPARPGSDIQILGEGGVLLDEAEAGLGLGAHQRVDGLGDDLLLVGDLDLEEGARAPGSWSSP